MKALIIEDNKNIAKNIQKYLEVEHIESKVAYNGLYGLEIAKKQFFDIIVLDIMLPGIDGIEICKNIKKNKDIPVIMTTAKGELDDKLNGFEVGADDYLVKPFDLEELVARMRALTKNNNKTIYDKNNIHINVISKKITKNNKEIRLTNKEFLVLELLIENKGIAVSRTTIIEEIRGGEDIFGNDGKLDVYISNLRRKLGKNFIKTIKGFGYSIAK